MLSSHRNKLEKSFCVVQKYCSQSQKIYLCSDKIKQQNIKNNSYEGISIFDFEILQN